MGFSITSSFHAISLQHPLLHLRSHKYILNGSNSHPLISLSLRRHSHHLPSKSPSINNSNFTHKNTNIVRNSSRNSNLTVRLSTSKTPQAPSPSSPNRQLIIITSAVTVTLAVANRVLYKLALVPMKQYPFFLAQLTTFGYVVIYFSILYTRYRMGIVSDEMIGVPKSRFMAIGILEALGAASGMASAAMLPGPAIPILNQTFLVWQLALSACLLGKKYSLNQIAGCLLVATGVVLAVASGSNAGQMLSGVEFVWPAIMIASCAFQAGASIIKEFVFVDAKKRLKGKSLDIFVVNSFGSGFQALFVLFFLPLLSNLKGIPFAELPSYLKSGVGCFLNMGRTTTGCDGAPLLPLLYMSTNMAFNISVLSLLKISSAVVASLVVMLSVPLSIYALSLPLPYLPDGMSLSPFFLFGSLILVLGLIIYNIPQPVKQSS
ncbi:protein CLT2, chloroplastic [Mangifera indica]|uniref:protein CLT2, chloroplastic n=1 Tax=Mangifera indica TaxID=29780 RepID=UPI001CF95A9B|nr:protein CLT2, chloroplastic [Mangifera indica]